MSWRWMGLNLLVGILYKVLIMICVFFVCVFLDMLEIRVKIGSIKYLMKCWSVGCEEKDVEWKI